MSHNGTRPHGRAYRDLGVEVIPALYENLAVRLKPGRVALIGLGVAAGLIGAVPFLRWLAWGTALIFSGLGFAAYWFHPRGGLGPRSTRRRGRTPPSILALSWPAAVLLDLWLVVGAFWIVLGIWALTRIGELGAG